MKRFLLALLVGAAVQYLLALWLATHAGGFRVEGPTRNDLEAIAEIWNSRCTCQSLTFPWSDARPLSGSFAVFRCPGSDWRWYTPNDGSARLATVDAGWPFRSVYGVEWACCGIGGTTGSPHFAGLRSASTLEVAFLTRTSWMPFVPRASHTLANSAVFGIAIFVAANLYFRCRARIRLTAGRCPNCGYRILGGGLCTECGKGSA